MIVLSVLRQFTNSDNHFGIFKLFLSLLKPLKFKTYQKYWLYFQRLWCHLQLTVVSTWVHLKTLFFFINTKLLNYFRIAINTKSSWKNYYFSKKKSPEMRFFFQNYIKFTKDPKQTKILILQFAKSIAVGHSYFWKNKNRLIYLKNKSWLIHAILFFFRAIFFVFCFFFVKASMFLHHTSITNQHLPYMYLYRRSCCSWEKNARVHIFVGK